MIRRFRTRQGFTLIEIMIVVAIIAILAAILVPNFVRARAQSQYTACKQNLKSIATAIEMFSAYPGKHTAEVGRYPTTVARLVPDYLKAIPTCPSVGISTYTAGYIVTKGPDAYTIYCKGMNHGTVGAASDLPAYSSQSGLIERN